MHTFIFLTMKTRLIIYLLIAASAAACHGSHDGHDHGHDAPETEENHEEAIELHSHSAERFGVVVDTIQPADFREVVRAAGCVVHSGADDGVVAAPVSGTVSFAPGMAPGKSVSRGAVVASVNPRAVAGGDDNSAAAAALDNARAELKRIESLHAEKLATAAEVSAARNAVRQAEAAYSPAAAAEKAKAPIGGSLSALMVKEGEYVGAGDPVAIVCRGEGSLLRVDLPRRYFRNAPDFTDMYADFTDQTGFCVSERGGRRITGAVAGDSEVPGAYIPLYFSAGAASLPPGTPFTAYLHGKTRRGVLSLPVEALSEQGGLFFVYRRIHDGHYDKMPVRVGASDGRRVEIVSGLEPGMEIVTQGVAAVRLAETSAVAPQGHSHNH